MTTNIVSQEVATRNRLAEDRELRWMVLEERVRFSFTRLVRSGLEVLGLTQKDFAEKAGTSQPAVSRLLGDDDERSPTLETMVRYADALGKDLKVEFVARNAADAHAWESAVVSPPIPGWVGGGRALVATASAGEDWLRGGSSAAAAVVELGMATR